MVVTDAGSIHDCDSSMWEYGETGYQAVDKKEDDKASAAVPPIPPSCLNLPKAGHCLPDKCNVQI